MQQRALTWQQLQPNISFTNYTANQNTSFIQLQPRVQQAIKLFLANDASTILTLSSEQITGYADHIQAYIQEIMPAPENVTGVKYWLDEDTSTVKMTEATSINDNFAAQKQVYSSLNFDYARLFGGIAKNLTSKHLELQPGLVHQLNGGVLILPLHLFVQNFRLWQKLKEVLLSKQFCWTSQHPYKALPFAIPCCPIDLKIVLLTDHISLLEFSALESELLSLGHYSEIEDYYLIENEQHKDTWSQYIQLLATQNAVPSLSQEALLELYRLGMRVTENEILQPINPQKLVLLLKDATHYMDANAKVLDDKALKQANLARDYQHNMLKEYSYLDILSQHIHIETDGEQVGQINGLSVIEYPEHPLEFGVPTRISCTVQFGDGEIVDVERKNDLAGRLHSKGMMIVETCLANQLELQTQLPFSASVVFEQSYSDIDGDSASLAEYCVLVSALSNVALPQSIAVTGTIDQFGLVHAVGGINHKIEGFFEICIKRGLTGKQGVIVPKVIIKSLSLSDAVVDAVKQNLFSIWPVENVTQALKILTNKDLLPRKEHEDKEDDSSLASLIKKRIEQQAWQPHGRYHWKLWHWLKKS